ncbi:MULTISPECIES: alpha-N-arabinofuranosidase [Pedobacter]|uniref:non-reducing end alpha-L-arabinofuranosidase n=1 Tax=Pedobacter zeae TaxID=1737356 RepID=A0A7W6P3X0_9SPHI|nr:alpha-L-arabinofuranosidase C-terminal domain-containing protein [Pedobacter zeae]MBB4106208.1 alpha-N-arabinofuranosidase [Pedobacter zeae]GGH00217.1 alpha-N-arabinofuranosidase [Pedobacter zeae]
MKKLFFSAALFCSSILVHAQNETQLTIKPAGNQVVSKHIYGHFSEHLGRCIYDGFWVDENSTIPNKGRIRLDIVDALKKIKVPNLRWPGGCFADEYHWRDGIGPRNQRPKMVNTNWGGVTEDNSFGTHEFLDLCQMINCEPYIAGNVGSGTVEEMAKWVEYLNFDGVSPMTAIRSQNGREKPWKVSFWGVGNESWGCGGSMTPAYYSDLYRRYATYARNYPGAPLKKIASGANSSDYNWTETCMKNIGDQMWGLTLHYYTIPTGNWGKKGSATKFDEKEYFSTMKNCLQMEELVTKHSEIMDKYDPKKKVALVVDEWGIWTDVEPGTNPGFLYQQNSLRDALIAGTTLNIFNNHSDRVKMANLAQTVNVLQALVLTEKDKMVLTPTYHVFDLYKVHQDAKYLPIAFTSPEYTVGNQKIPALNVSASQDSSGAIHISLVNLDPNKKIALSTALEGLKWSSVSGQILTSAKLTDVNTFNDPNKVHNTKFTGAKKSGNSLKVELPAQSIVVLELK